MKLELIDPNEIMHYFYDCSLCGLCCRDKDILINGEDLKRISKYLNVSYQKFLDNYTSKKSKKEILDNYYGSNNLKKFRNRIKINIFFIKKFFTSNLMIKVPCKFLHNKRCNIYDVRPNACIYFPIYIYKNSDIIEISSVYRCPLATHFFEGLMEFNKKFFPEEYKKEIESFNLSNEVESNIMLKLEYYKMYSWFIIDKSVFEKYYNQKYSKDYKN